MSSQHDRFQEATNPRQYDALSWESEADPESPSRKLFWNYLKPYQAEWIGKTVFEIGSGTGWFLKKVRDAQPKKVVGIEPGVRNVEFALKQTPSLELYNESLETFETNEVYDAIVSVMVFSHISDLGVAFKKIEHLLAQEGKVYMIVPDFEYNRTPRFGYEMDILPVNEEEYIVTVSGRGHGKMSDVMRTTDSYLRSASAAGLVLSCHDLIKPTDELIRAVPKYEQFRDVCIARLFVFRKG